MNFDRLHAYIMLLWKQRKEREIFIAHGIDNDALNELFRADYREVNHDAVFYVNLDHYLDSDSKLSFEQEYSFGLMEDIENPDLYRALKALKPIELEIVIRHAVMGEQIAEIAREMGRPRTTISSIYNGAKKKIKMFF